MAKRRFFAFRFDQTVVEKLVAWGTLFVGSDHKIEVVEVAETLRPLRICDVNGRISSENRKHIAQDDHKPEGEERGEETNTEGPKWIPAPRVDILHAPSSMSSFGSDQRTY